MKSPSLSRLPHRAVVQLSAGWKGLYEVRKTVLGAPWLEFMNTGLLRHITNVSSYQVIPRRHHTGSLKMLSLPAILTSWAVWLCLGDHVLVLTTQCSSAGKMDEALF